MLSLDDDSMNEVLSAQDVDVALSRIAEFSRRLRYTRNFFAPINKLPLELLSGIFLYLQIPDNATFAPVPFREWHRVIHVCRHWRDVAHNCPLLWTKVDICAHPMLIEEKLMRSRNAGLEVKVQLSRPTSRTLDNWKAVVTHLGRLRILNLAADAPTCKTLLGRALIDVEVPRLEALRIVSNDRSTSVELPSGLFGGGAPRLRLLELVGCHLSWDMPFLVQSSRIKTLILRDLPTTIPMESFVHVLRTMPLLEVLDLAQCLPPASSLSALEPLHLEHLQQLLLHDAAAGALSFLKNIQQPPSISLTVSCEAFDMIDKVSGLSSLFGTAFEAYGAHCLRDFYVNTSTLSCALRATRSGFGRSPLEYPINVVLDGPISVQRLIDVVSPLPLLENITSLSLDGQRVIGDRSAIHALLHAVSNLQTLHVYHKAAMTLLAVLCADAEAPAAGTVSLLLPRLEHLLLEDMDMNWVLEHTDVLSQLQETQFLRSVRGRPVSELTLTACRHLTTREITVLCHLFVDVHWDGYDLSSSDDESGAEEVVDETEDDPELWEMWEGNTVGWHS